jgi:Citrate synthase, C-terminal domain
VSGISRVEPDRVEVRGRDLAHDLMGRMTFTEYFHLLVGRKPTEEERFFLDVLLVAIAEHGMMPSNVAARMTLAAQRCDGDRSRHARPGVLVGGREVGADPRANGFRAKLETGWGAAVTEAMENRRHRKVRESGASAGRTTC